MSARSMNLDVIVRMRDLLSGPISRLRRTLDSLVSFTRKIGILGTAIAGLSFMAPIAQAAEFQQKLLDIAGTQNQVGASAFRAVTSMKGQFEELGLLVGQTSDDIAAGAGRMIAAGIDMSVVDKSLLAIGRSATASNTPFSEMADVATSLIQTLKVKPEGLEEALDSLVTAGKLGSFELKDMARYFPTLTSQMAKFGVTGREAVDYLGSALQIARKGTADPAEAANNLKNFLSKILAPTTIKSFKEAGVDIEAVMQDAAIKGINPIEAVMQKINKLTGISGGEIAKMMEKAKANGLEGADALAQVREQLEQIYGAGKLGELFSDMQVMDFLIPFMTNVDEYKSIKEEVAKATGAMTDLDFKTQMEGINRQLITFREIGTQAWREVGLAFGTWLPQINETLSGLLKWLRETDEETGGLVRKSIALGGAALIAVAGLGALGLALPVVLAGITALFAPLRMLGSLFRMVSRSGRGIGTVADSLDRVNAAATKANGIRRPSIWGMLFSGAMAYDLVSNIPSEPDELKKFMDENKKRSEGWNSWLGTNIGTPRQWLGLDKKDEAQVSLPKVDLSSVEELRKNLASITVDWPVNAQLGMRDYQNALMAGGDEATAEALSIGNTIRDSLQIVASPDIQTGELQKALDLTKQIAAELNGISGAVSIRAQYAAVNDNQGGGGMIPAQAPPQQLNVTTESRVKVEGPAKVVESNTTVSSPSRDVNTGRVIGRN